MRKLILVIMFVLLLPMASYAKCCDCCQDKQKTDYSLGGTGTITPRYINITDTGINKLIGKMIHRTRPTYNNDKTYMDRGRKLLAVTSEYLILSSDILAKGQFELDRSVWDDGNWEEHKEPLRLIVNEVIRMNTYHLVTGTSNYSCIRCGSKLYTTQSSINYYCARCKIGFDIKEE